MGVGGGGGVFKTYSNQPPARPEEMHAAMMAMRPILALPPFGVEGVLVTPSSWTVATPIVRRKRENHFRGERVRRKNITEKMAAVKSFS